MNEDFKNKMRGLISDARNAAQRQEDARLQQEREAREKTMCNHSRVTQLERELPPTLHEIVAQSDGTLLYNGPQSDRKGHLYHRVKWVGPMLSVADEKRALDFRLDRDSGKVAIGWSINDYEPSSLEWVDAVSFGSKQIEYAVLTLMNNQLWHHVSGNYPAILPSS